jgi:hypothetical protein
MKRSWIVFTLAFCVVLFTGAENIRSSKALTPKKVCNRGYTVIEASMGVDCNGDTLQLRKVGGFYEPVYPETPRLSRVP